MICKDCETKLHETGTLNKLYCPTCESGWWYIGGKLSRRWYKYGEPSEFVTSVRLTDSDLEFLGKKGLSLTQYTRRNLDRDKAK